jgi:UDP-N-acetylenolpyruvoylglucosamine reductase
MVNDFYVAIQVESFACLFVGDGANILVDDELSEVNLLRTRADERQGGENDGQKQCFHSVQMLLKGF